MRKLRLRLFKAQKDEHGLVACAYCGQTNPLQRTTIDHVVPLSMGGKHSRDNTVLCCEPCNAAKSSIQVDVFRRWLKGERGRAWVSLGPDRGEPTEALWRERFLA